MSALATVLGLLLLATYLGQYLLVTLPNQEQEAEFEHTLLVENQVARLQSTIYSQATSRLPFTLPSPVTLGSQAVPPFGLASSSVLSPELPGTIVNATLMLATIVPIPIDWDDGTSCIVAGNGTCNGAFNTYYYNATGNHTIWTFFHAGGNSNLYYDILGSNDTLDLTWQGGNTGNITVVIDGSNDTVNFAMTGKYTNAPQLQFLFFGQNDLMTNSISGAMGSTGVVQELIQFVGSVGTTCPVANASATDRLGANSVVGAGIEEFVTWWNFVGYTSPPHTLPVGNGNITFQNESGFVACAFTKVFASSFEFPFLLGIRVHLNNRYTPVTDIVYDGGAVVLSHPGLGSILVDPPRISFQKNPSGGYIGNFTFVSTLGTFVAEAGTGTATVLSKILSAPAAFHAANTVGLGAPPNASSGTVLANFWLNLTTPYPQAWMSFLSAVPRAAVPGGFDCDTPTAFPAPYTCLVPPPGVSVDLTGILQLTQVSLRAITVGVQVV